MHSQLINMNLQLAILIKDVIFFCSTLLDVPLD
jgi:hypothetical protein